MAQQHSERAPYSLRLRLFAEQCLRLPDGGGAEPGAGESAGAALRRHPLIPPPGWRPAWDDAAAAAACGWPAGLEAASAAAAAALEKAAAGLAAAAADTPEGGRGGGGSVRCGGLAARWSLVQVVERGIWGAQRAGARAL